MIIRILPIPELGRPSRPGVIADWEIVFTEGPLRGLKLLGGSIWESKFEGGAPWVSLPTDTGTSFELLRGDEASENRIEALDRFKRHVLKAWKHGTGYARDGEVLVYSTVNLDVPLPE